MIEQHKLHVVKRSHNDILNEYWHHIKNTFSSLDAIAPKKDDLYDSPRWKYCQTINKKDRKKIGYICRFESNNGYDFIKITVNHFKLGKATFNSLILDKDKRLSHQHTESFKNKTTHVLPKIIDSAIQRERQERLDFQEEQKKEFLFKEKLQQWEKASNDIQNHAYAIKKQLDNNNLIRRSVNLLIYPLTHTESGKICGIQTINEKGEKRFYGKQKNAYAVLGDLEKATVVYLCEGYATANAVMHLASRDTSFAVINTLNCHNLIPVAQWLKKQYVGKKLIIAADNDQKTAYEEKGNAGLWYGSKAAMLTQATLLYPKDKDGKNIDWCDAWINTPHDATIDFRGHKKTPFKEIALNRFGYASQKIGQSEIFSAVRDVFQLFLPDYPLKLNENELIETIEAILIPFSISTKKIKSIWVIVKKQQFSKALRAKTFSFNPDNDRYTVNSCNSMSAMANEVNALKSIHPRAIFVTNAPMGTGKTQTLMMPNFKDEESAGHCPVIITPTQALTKNVAEKFQTAHYQKERDLLTDKNGLAITINSIIQEPFEQFLEKSQSVFIDEYTQVLRAITSGTVKPSHRQKTHQQLSDLIKKSQYVYIADADLNTIALQDLIASTDLETPIFVMTLEKTEKTAPHTLYPCSPKQGKITTLHLLQEAINKNEPCYVVADSRKKIAVLSEYLKDESVHALVISSESIKTERVQNFLHQPDTFLRNEQPDIVMVSPAIQSGLSIESDYFQHVIGVYTGTVAPAVFTQMLNRVRTPVSRHIIITENRGKTYGNENSDALLSATYSQYIQKFGETHLYFDRKTGVTHIGHLSLQQTEKGLLIQGDPLFERFERLSAQLTALEHQQKNQSSAFFAMQTMAEGVPMEIKQAVIDDVIKVILDIKEKTATNAAIEERYNAVCGEVTLVPSSYRQLKSADTHSIEEIHAMQQFEIADALHIDEIKPSDVDFFDNDGKKILENYQDLQRGLIAAKQKDEIEQQQAVSKQDLSMNVEKVRLLMLLFNILGIDMDTGEGNYQHEKALIARNKIRQDDALSRYVLLKLSLSVNSALSDVAFVNKAIKKLLGLKPERRLMRDSNTRSWIYAVTSAFESLIKYTEHTQYDKKPIICHQK